ncbi:hypothetical protein CP8484711_1795A, partial [Chlamydia psittaci 84-8471/1]
MLSIFTTNSGA